jgi:hypothetical protein
MKKLLIVAAALAGGMFTAVPVTVAKDGIPAKCLFFPLLQSDCRAAIRAAAADSKFVDVVTTFPSPLFLLRCERNHGGKSLFVCH